jgi:cellulose synthase/poly-beta-1,6-N-acetylglucosamine synthase-like glycosyltransferase
MTLLQVVAVFDADQVARPNFFTRTLPWLQDGRESVVLTPQYFHNFDVQTDIFSHRQAAYWNMILPGQVSQASARSDTPAINMLT